MVVPTESWASTPGVRRSMRGNRSRDTSPELAVRRLVHAAGLRYLVDARPLPELNRRADLVFRGPRIAVLIDGCFWHGCPEHHTVAQRNAEFWATKVAGNIARDRDTDERLSAAGWTVLRFWEHQPPGQVAAIIAAAIQRRR
ncbi:MAG: very short patch repair endonuclease [Nocardioidaceae bacterium]